MSDYTSTHTGCTHTYPYAEDTTSHCSSICTYDYMTSSNKYTSPPPHSPYAHTPHTTPPPPHAHTHTLHTIPSHTHRYHGRVLFEVRLKNCWLENAQMFELNLSEQDVSRRKRHPLTSSSGEARSIAHSSSRRSPTPPRHSRHRRSPSPDSRYSQRERRRGNDSEGRRRTTSSREEGSRSRRRRRSDRESEVAKGTEPGRR